MEKEKSMREIKIGDPMPVLVKGPLQKLQLVRYAGASGDFNPLHTDDDFARQVGIPDGVIAHGMLIMGFVGEAVASWISKRNLRRLSVRFLGMTKLGSTITVSGEVMGVKEKGGEKIITCSVTAKDENGDVKLSGSFDAALKS